MRDFKAGDVVVHKATKQRMVVVKAGTSVGGDFVECDSGDGNAQRFAPQTLQHVDTPTPPDFAKRLEELEQRVKKLEEGGSPPPKTTLGPRR
jgi:hypothetical protein